jgi:hypothetical protein
LGMATELRTTCDRKVLGRWSSTAHRTQSFTDQDGVFGMVSWCGDVYKVYSPAPSLLDHLPAVNPQYRLQR